VAAAILSYILCTQAASAARVASCSAFAFRCSKESVLATLGSPKPGLALAVRSRLSVSATLRGVPACCLARRSPAAAASVLLPGSRGGALGLLNTTRGTWRSTIPWGDVASWQFYPRG
jgi:hypothetical protein